MSLMRISIASCNNVVGVFSGFFILEIEAFRLVDILDEI